MIEGIFAVLYVSHMGLTQCYKTVVVCTYFQDSGGRRFGNTQKGISWPILDKFAPNVCADKYGEYKGHKRPIIALFVYSRWPQHLWEFKMGWPPS